MRVDLKMLEKVLLQEHIYSHVSIVLVVSLDISEVSFVEKNNEILMLTMILLA